MIQAWPTKSPGDVLRYYVDYGQRLEEEDGGAIVSYTVTVTGSDAALVKGDVALSPAADILMIWLSGGTVDVTYTVHTAVTLTDGTVIQYSRTITIAEH